MVLSHLFITDNEEFWRYHYNDHIKYKLSDKNVAKKLSKLLYFLYQPNKQSLEFDLSTFLDLNDDNKLSYAQISTKTVIAESLKNYENVYADMNAFFMDVRYVDQYGGYCANIPTYLEAYSLRSEQDIKDVISYVDSTYNAFSSTAL